MTIIETELTLREKLIGVQLVTEIGLTRDLMGQLEDMIRQIQSRMGAEWFLTLVEDYDCIYLCYLVSFGIFEYQCGDFWSRMSVELPPSERGRWFVRALESVGLNTFDQMVETERAQTYVSRILIHGGIPCYCLGDFFWALAKAVRRGAGDAADVLTYWRNSQSVLDSIDKPVRRFLLNGGTISRDLVDRCLEMLEEDAVTDQVPDAGRLGLPEYVVEGFVACRGQLAEELRGRQIVRMPRPRLVIDPWLPSGPYVELPVLPDLAPDSAWVVRADDTPTRVPCTKLESQRVLVKPARSWDVEVEEGGRTVRSFHLGGLERVPVLVFDPSSGRLSRDSSQVRSDDVWLGTPRTMTCEGSGPGRKKSALQVVEEFPPLEGTWEGWQVRHIALEGLSSIEYQTTQGAVGHVHVSRSSRPVLIGRVVGGIVGIEGDPIYPTMPKLGLPAVGDLPRSRWLVRIEASGTEVIRRADQLGELDGALDLESLVPNVFGDVSLRVHGPLGSDLRVRFQVVPDLEVKLPDAILGAGSTNETVTVRAGAGVRVEGELPGVAARLAIPEDGDEIPVHLVAQGYQRLLCQVQVSRLVWGLARDAGLGSRLGTDRVTVTTADLRSGAVRFLFVRTRRPSLDLRLTLEAKGKLLQVLEGTTHGDEGRAVFDLQRLADTTAASGSGHLRLFLEVGLIRAEIGRVVSPLEFEGVSVRELLVGEPNHLTLEIDGLTNQTNRVLRLWPLARPWEPPIVERLADGPLANVEIVRDGSSILPGRYLLELLVEDGWIPLSEVPDFSGLGARVLQIGSDDQVHQRLMELGETEPLDVLERTAMTGRLQRLLVENELVPVMSQAVRTWVAVAEGRQGRAKFSDLVGFCQSLAKTPDALASEIAGFASAGVRDALPLQRFALCLALAPQVREGPRVDDEVLQRLWSALPPIAALFEMAGTLDSPAALARCERYLAGRDDGGRWRESVGSSPSPVELGLSPSRMVEIERESKLVPDKILALDTHVQVLMEWLRKVHGDPRSAENWVNSARDFVEDQEPIPPALRQRLGERCPQVQRHQLGCYLPLVSLAACLHLALGSLRAYAAAKSLNKLLPMAGSLVMRDLVLARFLVATTTNRQAEVTGA